MNESRELAGASQPVPQRDQPDEAREIFPVKFEKDFKDYRGVEEVEEDSPLAPKGLRVPGSVVQPRSVTGLEDVSEDDLETSATTNAAKGS
jgi:hypothetical protein